MLKLTLETQWQRPNCAQPHAFAAWTAISDTAISSRAGRGNRLKLPMSRRPLYQNKRYGLPKKPRKSRAGGGKRLAVRAAAPALPPSWGDHGLF